MMNRIVQVLVLTLTFAALALCPDRVSASNYVVSDCGDNGGANQLRAKINEVKASGGGGTITFTCGPTITLTGGVLPTITDIVTINGSNTITLSGNNASRVFIVGSGATLTLNNIRVTNGYRVGDGGAIDNGGTLNLNGVKFLNNHAVSGSGGALISFGTLNITNSEFADNTATNGGALYLKWGNSAATITGSNFHDNETLNLASGWGGAILVFDGARATISTSKFNTNQAGFGGGIYNYYANATLTGTTLSGNTAGLDGGGIYNDFGTTNATNVTFSGNSAAGDGGGIHNTKGTATLINNTFSGNSASYGGGILDTKDASTTLKNNLIAKGASGENCSDFAGYGDFNLSDDNTCKFGPGRDNVNPLLGPLANNGGLTLTHLPSSNPQSPAIDNAGGSDCPSTDQRGFTRPEGLACDVGAVEAQLATPTPTRTATRTPTQTQTRTRTRTVTRTPTQTPTGTVTRTSTRAATVTRTATRTPTTGCQSKPAKPLLKSPADNANLALLRPKLKWKAATCALTYQVVVKDAETGTKVSKKGGLTVLKYKTDPLPTGRRYKWTVKACNPPFGCAKSAARFFTVQ